MIGGGIGVPGVFNGVTGESDTSTNLKSVLIPNTSGVTRYVEVNDDPTLSFTDDVNDNNVDRSFTWSCWVKGLWSGPGARGTLWSKGNTTLEKMEYRVFAGENRIYVDLVEGEATGSSDYNRTYWTAGTNGFPSATTAWVHLVFTYSGITGSAVKIYRNGVNYAHTANQGAEFGGMEDMPGRLQFGVMQGATTYALNGNLCQVVMWRDWQATQQDVDYLYAGGAKHRNPTTGSQEYGGATYLVGWWPMAKDLKDYSLNGNIGVASTSDVVLEAVVPF